MIIKSLMLDFTSSKQVSSLRSPESSCLSFSIFFWVLPRTFLTSLEMEHNWAVNSVWRTKLCHNLYPSSSPHGPVAIYYKDYIIIEFQNKLFQFRLPFYISFKQIINITQKLLMLQFARKVLIGLLYPENKIDSTMYNQLTFNATQIKPWFVIITLPMPTWVCPCADLLKFSSETHLLVFSRFTLSKQFIEENPLIQGGRQSFKFIETTEDFSQNWSFSDSVQVGAGIKQSCLAKSYYAKLQKKIKEHDLL